MQTARRRRTTGAVTASAIAHAVVLTALALHTPVLRPPEEPPGPPQAIIPVLLMPRSPPARIGTSTRPEPLRLHRRPQRFVPPQDSVTPLITPKRPVEPTPAAPAPVARPALLQEGPKAEVRAALRQGLLGCANAQATNLDRAERDLCDERMGRGAKDAPFLGPGLGLSREKRAQLDQAAGKREADAVYMERPAPPSLNHAPPQDYSGEPYTSGVGAANPFAPVQHAPSTRAARKLDRLPP